jgi:hypothetical protein
MSMWEPFSEPARRTIVRAQEVAQLFASSFVGTQHLAFALAEGDDDVATAVAGAIDRVALRERLGAAGGAPADEMVFNVAAKRTIESAFENARRLNQNFIGAAHLALGVLDSGDPPPLVASASLDRLRTLLIVAALGCDPAEQGWKSERGDDPPGAVRAMLGPAALLLGDRLASGTKLTITVEPPAGGAQTWSWTYTGRGR